MILNVRHRDAMQRLFNGGYWYRWFAWYPIRIGHNLVWLETIERRREWIHCIAGSDYEDHFRYLSVG